MLSPNIIIPYDGTHASIPSGWDRDTRFDGKYVKATTSDLGNTGGNATHTHTSPSHTHTYTSNSHTHTTGTMNSSSTHKSNAQHQSAPPQDVSPTSHIHASQTSGAMASVSITSVAATVGTTNNEYSKYDFIFLKSATYNFFPIDGIILRNDTTTRAKASHFDTADGKYMKGASTSSDAGNATTVTTHTHTQTHDHTLTHNHGSVSTGGASALLGGKDIPSSSPGNHSHTVNFTQHQEVVSNSTAAPAYTNDLAYKELHFWKCTSKALPIPGDIALHIDGAVPIGWTDLALNDVFVRGKATGQALATGGSLTHTHTSITHSHTGSSHTHAFTTTSTGGSNAYRDGGSDTITGNHTHSGTTSSTANANAASNSLTFSTDNFEPEYVKVRYIQFEYGMGGAALFAMA